MFGTKQEEESQRNRVERGGKKTDWMELLEVAMGMDTGGTEENREGKGR